MPCFVPRLSPQSREVSEVTSAEVCHYLSLGVLPALSSAAKQLASLPMLMRDRYGGGSTA